MGVRNSAGAK
uniref:Uncharacterized protein n=1 Tax=Arundo donax TaxID=35708 RepID=A0A0A9G911_ARUDO